MSTSPASVEDVHRVELYETTLQAHLSEVVDHYRQVAAHYGEAGRNRLACDAWPLRPLFLNRSELQTLGQALSRQLQACRKGLLNLADSPREMARALRFPEEALSRFERKSELPAEDFLSAARPDGFLFSDRFVLSEYNVGSGLMATLSYTEVLSDLFERGPVARRLGWSDHAFPRPFQAYLNLMRRRAGDLANPKVAVFTPSLEQDHVYDWERELFQLLLERNGLVPEFVNEDGLRVSEQGALSSSKSGKPFDLLLRLTTGESYLASPQKLDHDAPFLKGSKAAGVPHLHPLSCLLMGKGILPSKLGVQAEEVGGRFRLEQDRSFYLDAERATECRMNKDAYVIKRSWTGKDTLIGCSTGGRPWNRLVAEAVDSDDFIVQEYCSLPVVRLPFLVEGCRLERLPVRFELSPFLIEGRYAGSLVRYAPDAEGVRLSPSPPQMGLTVVV